MASCRLYPPAITIWQQLHDLPMYITQCESTLRLTHTCELRLHVAPPCVDFSAICGVVTRLRPCPRNRISDPRSRSPACVSVAMPGNMDGKWLMRFWKLVRAASTIFAVSNPSPAVWKHGVSQNVYRRKGIWFGHVVRAKATVAITILQGKVEG